MNNDLRRFISSGPPRERGTVAPTTTLDPEELERALGWRRANGRTFEIHSDRPRRLFDVTQPVREACIEWAVAEPEAHRPGVDTWAYQHFLRWLWIGQGYDRYRLPDAVATVVTLAVIAGTWLGVGS